MQLWSDAGIAPLGRKEFLGVSDPKAPPWAIKLRAFGALT